MDLHTVFTIKVLLGQIRCSISALISVNQYAVPCFQVVGERERDTPSGLFASRELVKFTMNVAGRLKCILICCY